jgi:hypothetical protein
MLYEEGAEKAKKLLDDCATSNMEKEKKASYFRHALLERKKRVSMD